MGGVERRAEGGGPSDAGQRVSLERGFPHCGTSLRTGRDLSRGEHLYVPASEPRPSEGRVAKEGPRARPVVGVKKAIA